MRSNPIVVVGSTTDYIDYIRSTYPGGALFVTDGALRSSAVEPRPEPHEELLCDLRDVRRVLGAVNDHLQQWHMHPSGVACFDCESLELAAHVAGSLDLPFPTPAAVVACRNKHLCKQVWSKVGLSCPRAELLRSPSELPSILKRLGLPVILKPLTGSGSELVFKCTTARDCTHALATIQSRLAHHRDERMYKRGKNELSHMDSRREFVVETFIEGPEYSCDVIIDGRYLKIIRIAKKIPASDQSTGTTLAYLIPGELPRAVDQKLFRRQLHSAARSLGVNRAVCMVDFIVNGDSVYFLELAPRPGGDCLPWLIRESCGLDMLGLALEFAAGKRIRLPQASRWKSLVGVRFFAKTAGTVRSVDVSGLKQERRVKSYLVKAQPGYRVKLPPEDYDSRLLGHAVFEPDTANPILHQCQQIAAKLTIEMETDA